MSKKVSISMKAADVFQIINALENRAEAYEKTAVMMSGGNSDQGDQDGFDIASEHSMDQFFLPEEAKDASEAAEIARHFRDIIATLENQVGKTR